MSYVERGGTQGSVASGEEGEVILEVITQPVHAAEPGAERTVSGDHSVADLLALAYEWSEVADDDRCVQCSRAADEVGLL